MSRVSANRTATTRRRQEAPRGGVHWYSCRAATQPNSRAIRSLERNCSNGGAAVQTLFDELVRTDSTPARNQEGSFAFLNRIATPWWAEVRERLELWFKSYSADAAAAKAADLRARFRSRDDRQHLGAWWELYMYWLLRSLCPCAWIGIEPERRDRATRPDFCVAATRDAPQVKVWLEATTTFSGVVDSTRHGAREAYVLDAINEVDSTDFRVWITFDAVGDAHPRKRQLVGPLRRWLDSLNYEDVVAAWERGEGRATHRIRVCGWDIRLQAIPKQQRGVHPNDRLIGIGPITAGFVNDREQARKAIMGKAAHYGQLDAPFVVAVLPSSPFFDRTDAEEALYGSEAVQIDPERPEAEPAVVRLGDGVWSGAQRSQVSAVLFGAGVLPWTVGRTWPQLWINPMASTPLGEDLAAAVHASR